MAYETPYWYTTYCYEAWAYDACKNYVPDDPVPTTSCATDSGPAVIRVDAKDTSDPAQWTWTGNELVHVTDLGQFVQQVKIFPGCTFWETPDLCIVVRTHRHGAANGVECIGRTGKLHPGHVITQ